MHIQLMMSVASARLVEVMALRINRLLQSSSDYISNSHDCAGDYYLQVCSPLDALKHYASVISTLRKKEHDFKRHQHESSNQESEMISFQKKQFEELLASRLEGFAAAVELILELNLFNEPIFSTFDFKDVVETAGYEYHDANSLAARISARLNFRIKHFLDSSNVVSSENVELCVKRSREIIEDMLYEAISRYSNPVFSEPNPISEARCELKLAAKLIENLLLLNSAGADGSSDGGYVDDTYTDSSRYNDSDDNSNNLKFVLLVQVSHSTFLS